MLTAGQRIRYFSVDEVGHTEAVQTSPAVQVDTTPPTITASASDADGSAYASGS